MGEPKRDRGQSATPARRPTRAIASAEGDATARWPADAPGAPPYLRAGRHPGLANPAAAGLVNRIEDYPGLIITPDRLGVAIEVERPRFFFRENGTMPERVTLRFEIPPEFEHLGIDGYRALLWKQLRERECQHRIERRAEGRTVVGAKRLRSTALGRRSASWERWFTLRPAIAAKLRADRVAAIRALRAFRSAYREAWEKWRDGDRDVVFPEGTWWLPKYAGAATG